MPQAGLANKNKKQDPQQIQGMVSQIHADLKKKLSRPLLIFEITTSTVGLKKIERKTDTSLRKWLWLLPGYTDVALYCKKKNKTRKTQKTAETIQVRG